MVQWIRLAAVAVLALVIQAAVLDQIVAWGAHADVLVILPVAAGLVQGPQRGAIVGFVAGVAADLVVQLPFGLSALTFVLAGFAAGLIARASAASDGGLADVVRCALLAVATEVLYVLLGAAIGQPGLLGAQTGRALGVIAVGAVLLSAPVLSIMRWCFLGARRGGWSSVPSGGSALS
ncbi:MAG TPA: rod shape-determining protein MreD [Acidimicrobiales bacterium]